MRDFEKLRHRLCLWLLSCLTVGTGCNTWHTRHPAETDVDVSLSVGGMAATVRAPGVAQVSVERRETWLRAGRHLRMSIERGTIELAVCPEREMAQHGAGQIPVEIELADDGTLIYRLLDGGYHFVATRARDGIGWTCRSDPRGHFERRDVLRMREICDSVQIAGSGHGDA